MRAAITVLVVVFSIALGTVVAERGAATAVRAVSVTVDLRATRQTIDGFGSSERVWSDPHLADAPSVNVPAEAQAKIMTLLYRTIGLTRVRNVLDMGVQREKNGSFNFEGKLADAHIAYVKQARAYGLRTFFPGPVYLERWMTEDDPGATVDWAMAMLRHWRSLGLEPPYYAPLNEPKIAKDYAPEWMRQVVLQLGRKLENAGFRTKLVIPDDENPTDAYRRATAVLADPEARKYVGALAYHVYRWGRWDLADVRRLRALAARYRLPVWMTEYSSGAYDDWRASLDWAEKMHVLLTLGGVSAIDYLWGFFGENYGTDALVSIDFDDGEYRGHSATAVGAITAQYARFVRPGSVRVGIQATSDAVLASAYKTSRRLVVVATNPGGSPQPVRVDVRGMKPKPPKVARVMRSSENQRLEPLRSIRVRGAAFEAVLPSESVTTFVLSR